MSNKENPILGVAEKVGAESEAMRKHIDKNLALSERYKIFEGSSEDALILQAVIRYRKRQNPDRPAGLKKDNANFKKLAEYTGEQMKDKAEGERQIQMRLNGLREDGTAAATSLGDPEKAKLSVISSALTGYELDGHLDSGKPYKQLLESFQKKTPPQKAAEIMQGKRDMETVITDLGKDRKKAESAIGQLSAKNAEKGARPDILSATTNGLSLIKKHQDFAQKAYWYFAAQEMAAKTPIDEKIGAELNTQGRAAEDALDNDRKILANAVGVEPQSAAAGTIAKDEAQLRAVRLQKEIFGLKIGGTQAEEMMEMEKTAEGNLYQEREAVRITMDEYLMVRENFVKQGKLLGTDRNKRAELIGTAMINGMNSPTPLADADKTNLQKEIEAQGLNQLSEYEKLSAANNVLTGTAFDSYFNRGYWSDPKKNVAGWEASLDAYLASAEPGLAQKIEQKKKQLATLEKGAERSTGDAKAARLKDIAKIKAEIEVLEAKRANCAPYTVLSETLPSTTGNQALLEALMDRNHADHQKAREMLKGIEKEFAKRTEIAKLEKANQINYQNDVYENENTVGSRLNKVVGRAYEGMFGSGQPPEKRLAYGLVAYLVVFKGLFGKSPAARKLTWGVGGVLATALIYEDVTGKAALGFLGIDSVEKASAGTWLQMNAKNSGLDYNDKGGYRALDILKTKNVEDVIRWYDKQGEYGKTGDLGHSALKALNESGLMKSGELDSIMPDEKNPEKPALKFVDVVEKQLMLYGRKASRGSVSDKQQLIQIGREEMRKFTADYWKDPNKPIEHFSKAQQEDLKKGQYQWTWLHATHIISTAEDYEKAMETAPGPMAVGSILYNQWNEFFNKNRPSWLRASTYFEEISDKTLTKLKDWGGELYEVMKEYGGKGYEFAVESADEISVYWKENPDAIRIKRMGNGVLKIVETGLALPFIATLEVGDRSITSLTDMMQTVNHTVERWKGIRDIQYNMNPEPGKLNEPVKLDKATAIGKQAREPNDAAMGFQYNFIANGYDLFGKYEREFLTFETEKKPGKGFGKITPGSLKGIFANKNFFEPNSDGRLNFFPPEKGYITFVGRGEPDPAGKLTSAQMMEKAYREGVDNLARFLRKTDNAKYLNKDTDFWKAIDSGDAAKIRKSVEPLIENFGAFRDPAHGTMLMMRIPVPLLQQYLGQMGVLIKEKNADGSPKLDPKTKKQIEHGYATPQNDEFFKRQRGEWRYGNLDKYKKSMVFSSSLAGYEEIKNFIFWISGKNKDEFWTNKYKKEFGLWNDKQVAQFVNKAAEAAEGQLIEDIGDKDGCRQQFFDFLRKNYKETWMEQYNWTRTSKDMADAISKNLSAAEAKNFITVYQNLREGITNPRADIYLRDTFLDHQYILKRYRFYMGEKLAAYKMNKEVIPKDSKEKSPVKFFTQRFIDDEINSLTTAVPAEILRLLKKLMTGMVTLADKAIDSLSEPDKNQLKKFLGKGKAAPGKGPAKQPKKKP